jgi:hypothetical protein
MNTGGALYKRYKSIGYTPGSHYQRFGKLWLHQSRNMSAMNREAVSNYINSFSAAGSNMFAQKAIESQGMSEIAAQKLLQRVKAEMTGSTVNKSA